MPKTKPKKKPKKNKGGRPTKWKPEFMEQGKELLLSGFTILKLAKFWKVSRETLYQWMKENPKFSDTIIKAQDDYNSGKVEKSMLRAAEGFMYTETTKELARIPIKFDQDGNPIAWKEEMQVTKETRKTVPPNPTMNIFWLTNRAKNRWKHQNRMEHDISPEAANFIVNIVSSKK